MYYFEVTYKKNKNAKKLSTKYVNCHIYSVEKAMELSGLKYPVSAKLVLNECSFNEALKYYINSKPILIKDNDGDYKQIIPSSYYGSHASQTELFYRGYHMIAGYDCDINKEIFYVNTIPD